MLALQELGIGLVSRNATAAQRFYQDVLGFEPSSASGAEAGRRELLAGRIRLQILHAPHLPRQDDPGIYAGVGIRVLAVLVDELDAVAERIRSLGRRLAVGANLPGRLRIAFAKDPDGNLLELIGLPEPAGAGLAGRVQVGLTVRDAEATRRFYGDQLGLAPQPSVPIDDRVTRHAFTAAHGTLKFWTPPEPAPMRTGAPDARIGLRFLRFAIEDLDEACSDLERRGIAVLPPLDVEGAAGAGLRDPDGNWIELSQAL